MICNVLTPVSLRLRCCGGGLVGLRWNRRQRRVIQQGVVNVPGHAINIHLVPLRQITEGVAHCRSYDDNCLIRLKFRGHIPTCVM